MVTVPGYDDLTEIGRGGFATVYRARQESFNRTVAIKVLHATHAGERGFERFLRECRAAGSLSWHPGVVTVHEAGETDAGDPYLVMEFVERGAIAGLLPLPWREAIDVGWELAQALQAAHDAKLIHRDIKPENILVSRDGRPMLADFGIAALEEGESLTKTGEVTASVRHAPPEVLDGQGARPASDIWSLASSIHTLIRGQPPFVTGEDDSIIPLIGRIARDDPPDLTGYGVPSAVQAVLRRAMAKDPGQRWASAKTFGDALREAADPNAQVRVTVTVDDPATATTSPSATDAPATGRRREKVLAGVGLLVVAVTAAVVLLQGGGEQPDVEPGSTASAVADGSTSSTAASHVEVTPTPIPLQSAAAPGPVPSVVTGLDGQAATTLETTGAMDVVVGRDGLPIVALPGDNRVVRVEADGTVATIAGNTIACGIDVRGIGVPAVEAVLCGPERLALDADGALVIDDVYHGLVRRVDGHGLIFDLAGSGPDGGFSPTGGVTVHGDQLWTSDSARGEIRLGAGPDPILVVDGLGEPRGMAVDPTTGDVLVADADGRILAVTPDGSTRTVIGQPRDGEVDGIRDRAKPLANPWDVDVDADGRIWIADPGSRTVRYADPGGPLITLDVPLRFPAGVTVHPDGGVYVVDGEPGEVLRILPDLETVERVLGPPA